MERMSKLAYKVLQIFNENANDWTYGLQIISATGNKPGSVYPCLNKMREENYLYSATENKNQRHAGRPPRKYYRLTSKGILLAQEKLPLKGFECKLENAA